MDQLRKSRRKRKSKKGANMNLLPSSNSAELLRKISSQNSPIDKKEQETRSRAKVRITTYINNYQDSK